MRVKYPNWSQFFSNSQNSKSNSWQSDSLEVAIFNEFCIRNFSIKLQSIVLFTHSHYSIQISDALLISTFQHFNPSSRSLTQPPTHPTNVPLRACKRRKHTELKLKTRVLNQSMAIIGEMQWKLCSLMINHRQRCHRRSAAATESTSSTGTFIMQ